MKEEKWRKFFLEHLNKDYHNNSNEKEERGMREQEQTEDQNEIEPQKRK